MSHFWLIEAVETEVLGGAVWSRRLADQAAQVRYGGVRAGQAGDGVGGSRCGRARSRAGGQVLAVRTRFDHARHHAPQCHCGHAAPRSRRPQRPAWSRDMPERYRKPKSSGAPGYLGQGHRLWEQPGLAAEEGNLDGVAAPAGGAPAGSAVARGGQQPTPYRRGRRPVNRVSQVAY
jgi:hypothetical protein